MHWYKGTVHDNSIQLYLNKCIVHVSSIYSYKNDEVINIININHDSVGISRYIVRIGNIYILMYAVLLRPRA